MNNPECPKCKSDNTVKKGKTENGTQRYKCKDCGYRYNDNTTHIVSSKVILDKPQVDGIQPHEIVNFEDMLPYLTKITNRAKEKTNRELNQTITMPNKPFAISILADVHGGGKVDYEAIKRDIDIIRSDEDIHTILAGDLTDNFIIGKLQAIQREQSTTFEMESRFLVWFLEQLNDSLLVVVSGNHDNWTVKLSGIDRMKDLLRDTKCLYDRQQSLFTLKWGDNSIRFLVRHKYKHSSIFNPTHGMEVFWERGGLNWDIAIGGHTHIATLCRPFIKHDKKRFAVLLGTYKLRDEFGKEVGFANTHSGSSGSGAFVFMPDNPEPMWFDKLEMAKLFLDYVRSKK